MGRRIGKGRSQVGDCVPGSSGDGKVGEESRGVRQANERRTKEGRETGRRGRMWIEWLWWGRFVGRCCRWRLRKFCSVKLKETWKRNGKSRRRLGKVFWEELGEEQLPWDRVYAARSEEVGGL